MTSLHPCLGTQVMELQAPLSILSSSENPSEGDNLDLFCKVGIEDRGFEVKWTKNGQGLDDNVAVNRELLRYLQCKFLVNLYFF